MGWRGVGDGRWYASRVKSGSLTLGFLAAVLAAAQGPSGAGGASFAVASVRPVEGTVAVARPTLTRSRIIWQAEPYRMIAWAYSVTWDRVSGIPASNPMIRIEATFPPGTGMAEVRAMLRRLFEERMGMAAHVVTKQESGLAIVRGPRPEKIKPDPPPEDDAPRDSWVAATLPETGVILMRSHGAPLGELASALQRNLRKPVSDETGLEGDYTFEFRFAQDDNPEFGAPSLAGALRTALGLELEKKLLDVQSVVVDRISRAPTEN